MYEYYWGFTKAQIDLMNVDAPYTCYEADKSQNSGRKEPPSREKMEETMRQWEEKKKKRKFKLEDFLGKKDNPQEQSKKQ